MKLRDIIDSPCGLRYMIETLPVASGYSLRYLMDSTACSTEEEVMESYAALHSFFPAAADGNLVAMLHSELCTLKNISSTLDRLESACTVDDIELFEVKHLIMLGRRVSALLSASGWPALSPDVSFTDSPLSVLDPDGTGIASFYIYDSYSAELAGLRLRLGRETDPDARESLMREEQQEESRIRAGICEDLRPSVPALRKMMESLAVLDITFAKAVQVRTMNLCIPVLTSGKTVYKGMYHPNIKSILEKSDKEFTPIDIDFGDEPVVIIGANMGGKTVVLKMAALCQYLFSFGMGIPAESAEIVLKKRVFFISGDAQDMGAGLSSFAAEMTAIDQVVRASETEGTDIVAMIDEPARSTNPIEGTALVEALLRLMEGRSAAMLLTTHYNISSACCRRLRVAGVENGKMNYRLCPAPDGAVPHEALNVAESLNISPEWIGEAKKLLKHE